MAVALAGARIFDGARIVDGRAVLIDGERIVAVVGQSDLSVGVTVRRIEGLLAPGFIDIQVNGGGGVLFNADRSVQAIAAIGAAHRQFGVTGFLPTLITSSRGHMVEAITAAREALDTGVPGLLGIHLEGPFLNPARKGAHDAALIRQIDAADITVLTSLGNGKTLVTLAPEQVPLATISALARAGVILAAGHTAADHATIVAARREGLTGFTHLFNAMPPLSGREPGPVGAALDDDMAWCSLIVDLHHVAAANLRLAIAARGWERTILISDAMPTVGSDIDCFTLDGRPVIRRNGRLTNAEGVLAGSDLDMATAVRNSVSTLGLPIEAALHMASRAPAEFLGLGSDFGRIAPGYRANLVLLDDNLRVIDTWIDGKSSH
ncbi:MAG: N-acetylglucosamine-6-phosphate deacetylase [Bauldia sp.]